MSETPTPTAEETITLSTADKLALDRFKKEEALKKDRAEQREQLTQLLETPNQELEKCVGECEIERGTQTYDKFKDDTSKQLEAINTEFTESLSLILKEDLSEEDAEKIKAGLVAETKKKFDAVIETARNTIDKREDELSKTLFSKNIKLSSVDTAIIQNETLVNKMLQRPYEFLYKTGGEANASILVSLAQRGFMSDTYMMNNTFYDAVDRRYTPVAFSGLQTISKNRMRLEEIQKNQNHTFTRISHKKLI